MPAQTHISKLTLTNFRNYATLSIDLGPGAVVLSGDNGAGKTNLLEAISFLTPGRGLRRAPYGDVAREGGDGGFALHARLDGPARRGRDRHRHFRSREPAKAAGGCASTARPARSAEDMLEWLRVVWLTPAMDGLFTGPAADRRRFLDRLVLAIDPGHGQRALDYEKAMRGRNRLLTEGSRDGALVRGDRDADGRNRRRHRRGARRTGAPARRHDRQAARQRARFRRPTSASRAIWKREVATAPAVDVEERFRRALAERP